MIIHIANIGKMIELTLGQGHKVKGQGQMNAPAKMVKNHKKSTNRYI